MTTIRCLQTSGATGKLATLRGWGPIFVLPVITVLFTPPHWPRWLFMWLLALAFFAGCKWLTWRRTPVSSAPWWLHAGYLLAWPGLDAGAFLRSRAKPCNTPRRAEWLWGGLNVLCGTALYWGAAWVVPENDTMLLGWVGMVGFVLLVHFGFLHLLSCAWRQAGIDARPLMDFPLGSVSVAEFWGRGWNTAFRDLTYRFLFRPFTSLLGPRWAVAAGFAFSGVVHELVISVPAGAGYGWPTLFFVIQAMGLFMERSPWGQALGLGRGWRGWLFTMLVLVLPLDGLCHPPFVQRIVVPFMQATGAG